MTKTAKIQIATVYADCPECGGPLADESGSHCIPVSHYTRGQQFMCDDCCKYFPLELKAWK